MRCERCKTDCHYPESVVNNKCRCSCHAHLPKRNKFWLVWSPSRDAPNPQVCHNTYAEASAEADRLAGIYQEREFWVVGAERVSETQYIPAQTKVVATKIGN